MSGLVVPSVVGVAVGALVLAAALTAWVGRFAIRLGILDAPAGYKNHKRPTPYFGGLAVVAATYAATAMVLRAVSLRFGMILVAAAAVALLGLVDDLRPLSPRLRMAVETVAAVAVVTTGVRLGLGFGPLDQVITVVWIVGVTNAYNLMDNMDGALATVAIVSSSLLSAAGFLTGHPAEGMLMAALCHSCVGYLLHNWTPASIFMGDAGSLFIGFTVACGTAVVYGSAHGTVAAVGALLVPFYVVADTAVIIVSRKRTGRSVATPSLDHISHRLLWLGLGTQRIVVIMGTVMAVAGSAALAALLVPALAFTIVVSGAAFLILMVAVLQCVPIYPPAEAVVVPEQVERSIPVH